jgi:phage N-6-adenine-methyltransferase
MVVISGVMNVPSLSHKDDYFETPDWVVKLIKKETGLTFHCDVCASDKNSICEAYIDEQMDALNHEYRYSSNILWCNPPRSKNGKFVNKMYEVWEAYKYDIVMLLCWNDLGNKYGEKLLPHIINGDFKVGNLGKIKFNKDGVESEFVSRLTYFWCWMKSK